MNIERIAERHDIEPGTAVRLKEALNDGGRLGPHCFDRERIAQLARLCGIPVRAEGLDLTLVDIERVAKEHRIRPGIVSRLRQKLNDDGRLGPGCCDRWQIARLARLCGVPVRYERVEAMPGVFRHAFIVIG